MPDLRPGVADPRAAAGIAEGEALVRRAVVGEHPLHADPLPAEERGGPIEEGRPVQPAEGRTELAEDQPAGHIDRDMQVPPADAATRARDGDAGLPAASLQRAEALDVDPDELARTQRAVPAEAPPRLGKEVAEPLRPVPAEDPVHGARVQPELRADPVGTEPLCDAQCEHARLERVVSAPG